MILSRVRHVGRACTSAPGAALPPRMRRHTESNRGQPNRSLRTADLARRSLAPTSLRRTEHRATPRHAAVVRCAGGGSRCRTRGTGGSPSDRIGLRLAAPHTPTVVRCVGNRPFGSAAGHSNARLNRSQTIATSPRECRATRAGGSSSAERQRVLYVSSRTVTTRSVRRLPPRPSRPRRPARPIKPQSSKPSSSFSSIGLSIASTSFGSSRGARERCRSRQCRQRGCHRECGHCLAHLVAPLGVQYAPVLGDGPPLYPESRMSNRSIHEDETHAT